MAEDDSASSQQPPAHQQQHFNSEVKTEPASPSSSSRQEREYRDPYLHHRLYDSENGMTNGGMCVNGEYAASDDSNDCANNDDCDDGPLDFSMKPKTQDIERKIKRETSDNSRDYLESGESRSPPDRHPYDLSERQGYEVRHHSPVERGDRERPTAPVTGTRLEEMIGEPQTALPGMLPGTTIPTMPGAGFMPGLMPPGFPFINPALLGAMPQMPVGQAEAPASSGRGGKGGKATRPFKAYPKDPLSLPIGYYGLPGMPALAGIESIDPAVVSGGSEELFKNYLQQVQDQMKLPGSNGLPKTGSRQLTPKSVTTSPTSPTASQKLTQRETVTPPGSTTSSSPASTTATTPSSASRKRARILPDEQKDEAYWERRRKNNEAAKRSRDSRRAKEDEIAIRAAFLEQENLKLRVEVAALKNETAKLRCMLYNSWSHSLNAIVDSELKHTFASNYYLYVLIVYPFGVIVTFHWHKPSILFTSMREYSLVFVCMYKGEYC